MCIYSNYMPPLSAWDIVLLGNKYCRGEHIKKNTMYCLRSGPNFVVSFFCQHICVCWEFVLQAYRQKAYWEYILFWGKRVLGKQLLVLLHFLLCCKIAYFSTRYVSNITALLGAGAEVLSAGAAGVASVRSSRSWPMLDMTYRSWFQDGLTAGWSWGSQPSWWRLWESIFKGKMQHSSARSGGKCVRNSPGDTEVREAEGAPDTRAEVPPLQLLQEIIVEQIPTLWPVEDPRRSRLILKDCS